jgi:hypothetical protein
MFTAGMVVFVVELLVWPQFQRSRENRSSNMLCMVGKRSFLLMSDIVASFLKDETISKTLYFPQ